jgi:hypothetical protein
VEFFVADIAGRPIMMHRFILNKVFTGQGGDALCAGQWVNADTLSSGRRAYSIHPRLPAVCRTLPVKYYWSMCKTLLDSIVHDDTNGS